MRKRAGVAGATASRSRISCTHGFTMVGGTGLVAISRKLGEPWQSGLALFAPALSLVWAILLDAFLTWVKACMKRRQLERGLTRLKETANALPIGPVRSRIERSIKEVRITIADEQLRVLMLLAGGDNLDSERRHDRGERGRGRPVLAARRPRVLGGGGGA
jgi:hypothetical protein